MLEKGVSVGSRSSSPFPGSTHILSNSSTQPLFGAMSTTVNDIFAVFATPWTTSPVPKGLRLWIAPSISNEILFPETTATSISGSESSQLSPSQ